MAGRRRQKEARFYADGHRPKEAPVKMAPMMKIPMGGQKMAALIKAEKMETPGALRIFLEKQKRACQERGRSANQGFAVSRFFYMAAYRISASRRNGCLRWGIFEMQSCGKPQNCEAPFGQGDLPHHRVFLYIAP